jgi:hypothetical protein
LIDPVIADQGMAVSIGDTDIVTSGLGTGIAVGINPLFVSAGTLAL